MSEAMDVQYLVLPDKANPYLLAQVRWPDVSLAISAARPDWQDDPGLFDLPNHPSSATVTRDEAATIAATWGAQLAFDAAAARSTLIRRMPADWSALTPAEKRAWSLDAADSRLRADSTPSKAGFRAFLTAPGRAVRRNRRSELALSRDTPLPIDLEAVELSVTLSEATAESLIPVESHDAAIDAAAVIHLTGTADGVAVTADTRQDLIKASYWNGIVPDGLSDTTQGASLSDGPDARSLLANGAGVDTPPRSGDRPAPDERGRLDGDRRA